MLTEGDEAPDFTVPMVTPERAGNVGEYSADDISNFSLSDALKDGPVVLAFFPGAFSRTCTQEVCQMRNWHADIGELDAQVCGVSVDAPWSQLAFIHENDLNFPLLSGFNNEIIADYGVRHDEGLLAGIADRAVFVIGPDQTIEYSWIVHEPLVLPDLPEIESAIASASA